MSRFTITGFSDEIAESFAEQLAAVRRLGMEYIEPRGLDGINISSLTVEQAKEYKKMMDDAGVKVSSLGSPIGKVNIVEDFEPHYQKYLHTLELAEIFDARYIRMFSFYYPLENDPANYRNEVIERVGKFVEGAESYDVTLLLENELNLYGDTAARVYDVLHSIDSPKLRHTFDPANYVLTPQKVYPDAFELLVDYIEYLHIKDARWEDKSIQPSGQGDGCIKEVLQALQARDFKGFVSLEPHLGSFTGLASIQSLLNVDDLPQGGEGTFKIAYEALAKILREIGE